jgi:predicted transcriptional regulator
MPILSPRDFENNRRKDRKHMKSGTEDLSSGLIFMFAFGIVWFLTGWWFWVFPFVFAGVIPVLNGIRKIFQERKIQQLGRDKTSLDINIYAEKEILKIAKNQQGKVTPTMVALKSQLSVEEAEQILEKMAKKGYAEMHVTESGRVEYQFPEFLPDTDELK